jgi:hypothetical protein
MARQVVRSDLDSVPMFPHETLYVGVDVGKFRHVGGFLSRTLLKRHERFEGCPTFAFEQSREGFRAFVDRLRELVPIEQVTILLEHTGHYHCLRCRSICSIWISLSTVFMCKNAPKAC